MYCKCWEKIYIYAHGTKSEEREFKMSLQAWPIRAVSMSMDIRGVTHALRCRDKNHSRVEDMNRGQSNHSMAATRTKTTHGITYSVARAIE